MKNKLNLSTFIILGLIGAHFFIPQTLAAATATAISSPFTYNFSVDGSLVETNAAEKSTSGYWWVSSGGRMYLSEGAGHTVQGSLPTTDKWRLLYAAANPTDTDNGYHPQNIFRLVGRSLWHNTRQEAYFTIEKDNLTNSSNRNASNGILFFNRYVDQDNLYYTGLRVDGYAVIKKKVGGIYTTLAYTRVFPGTYNKSSQPNLLPKNTPIGLRSEVVTNSDGKVSIKLYTDVGKTGAWKLAAQAVDSSRVVEGSGFGGLRTDFMDVSFDQYQISEL